MTNDELTTIEARVGEPIHTECSCGTRYDDTSPAWPACPACGEVYDDAVIFILCAEVRRLREALNELMEFNHLSNDRDAYLLAMSEWGMTGKWGEDEEKTERPQRATFGLE